MTELPARNAKVLILVGFGGGNGLGIAQAFGKAGFSLALISRNPTQLTDALGQLTAAGITAESFPADAGNPDSLTGAIARAIARLGEPEILIYNAMAANFGRPSDLTPEGLAADLAVNVGGALVSALAVLPRFRAMRSGTIMFTGGGWALYPAVEAASASVGKAALRTLSLMLFEDLKGSGVRVGTLTIMGRVARGTAFDPENIGLAFLDYSRRQTDRFPPEILFTGR